MKDINKYGQFFTHEELCKSVIETINNIKGINGNILEPSFGSGNFINEIVKYSSNIDALEIDVNHFNKYTNKMVNLINSDFLKYETNKKYDFIIGNPPYIELCYSFYSKKEQEIIKNERNIIVNQPNRRNWYPF